MYCYSNNGFSLHSVPDNYTVESGEVLFKNYATEEQLQEAFTERVKINFTTAKDTKLSEISTAAATAYVAGFQSSATGTELWYDSDTSTQNQITSAALLALGNAATFAAMYPGGIIIRARASREADESTKQQYIHSASQIVALTQDMQTMLAVVKEKVWGYQEQVYACTTVVEVEAITISF